jgi:predicted TIM-barrel fold metal-dependent hydrolase
VAELQFVDTHVHYFDLQHDKLVYSWLQPGVVHPVIGNIDAMKSQRFDATAFVAETRFANVTKAVHVQAAIGTPDPVWETAWLDSMADETGLPTAIVACSALDAPDVGSELERHAEASNRVRGIRDFGTGDYLVDPSWQRGYALLERFGWLCDLDCSWQNMDKARDLARRFPGIPMVLEHAGFPTSRSAEYLAHWRDGISSLASAANTLCKISGLGMGDARWTLESLGPLVSFCIETFGVERCCFGTNWPVDRLFSSYDPLIDTYAQLIVGYSKAEQQALFSANAERIYRI